MTADDQAPKPQPSRSDSPPRGVDVVTMDITSTTPLDGVTGSPGSGEDTAAQDDLWQWMQPPADEARRLRDQGVETALNAADLRARGAAEEALRDLARSGAEFSSDDLHERVGHPMACSGRVMGALFLAAAKRGEIQHVGHTRSKRPSSHGREIRTWRGTGRTPAPSKPPAQPAAPATGQWGTGDTMEACVTCGLPAYLRDPSGRPRHKDCGGGRAA